MGFAGLLAAAAAAFGAEQSYGEKLIKDYRASMLAQKQPAIQKFVDAISKDGSWPDIDYKDKSMAAWKTLEHLNRVRAMALYLALQKQPQKEDAKIRQAIDLALDNWCSKRYKCPNWFFNEISVPRAMCDIIVLLGDDLKGDRRKAAIDAFAQLKMRATGANLMWSGELAFLYGCITGDNAKADEAARRIWEEVAVGRREGIQPDGSFYQHGSRLQTFHYGAGYLGTACKLAWQLRQTPWAMPKDKRDIISNYIIEGPQWMCRGNFTPPGTLDRASCRRGSLMGANLVGTLKLWREVHPERRKEFDAIMDRQEGKQAAPLTGYRHFPMGDFTAYHRPKGSFFLKTVSDRTGMTESINGENLKGVPFLNCGDHYVVQNGHEYHDTQPLWQWKYLPGLTTPTDDLKQKRTQFVGGIGNGQSGMTAMDYVREGSNGVALSVRKSWFFFEDTVLCLMCGSETGKVSGPVVSSLEQCRLRGPVLVRRTISKAEELKPGNYDFNQVRWILHNNIGYVPLNMAGVSVFVGPRDGNWHSIAEQYPATNVKEDMLQILASHGDPAKPVGWAIVIDATAKDLDAVTQTPHWKVLRNDRGCQSVDFRNVLQMAAFFEAGKSGGTPGVVVDNPCLAMCSADRLWIGDPTMRGSAVSVEWQQKKYSLKLPGGGRTEQLPPPSTVPPKK